MVDCNFVRNIEEFGVLLHQAVGILTFAGTLRLLLLGLGEVVESEGCLESESEWRGNFWNPNGQGNSLPYSLTSLLEPRGYVDGLSRNPVFYLRRALQFTHRNKSVYQTSAYYMHLIMRASMLA